MDQLETYDDYRKFLRDWHADKKARQPSYSYRQFCLKVGIGSPSFYKEVAEGKRNLTEAMIPVFVKGLGLAQVEAEFFGHLVRWNQAKDRESRDAAFHKLQLLRRKVVAKVLPLDTYVYYSRWYLPVLRELACVMDWRDDPARLAHAVRPAISATQAKKGVELLERLGMIVRKGKGWIQTDVSITTGSGVRSMAVRECNRQFAQLGADSIEQVPVEERDVSTVVMGISSDTAKQIQSEIRAFKQRILRLAQDDTSSDRVYALNVQLVPHSVVLPHDL